MSNATRIDARASAFLDLEEPIRELMHLSVVAADVMIDAKLPSLATEEEKEELDRHAFLVCQVRDRACALNSLWLKGGRK